ncbi:hypothetical protein BC749_12012 [Flavobacterium araucananum]|nr:hypothetical protein BC749_12012 [Flavobacterium araucananum]
MDFFNNPRHMKFFLLALIMANVILCVLCIENYRHTLKLQSKLDHINREFHLKDMIRKKQLKEY